MPKKTVKPQAANPNIFLTMVESLLSRGEDGEGIARELAEAFVHTVRKGVGPETAAAECIRLLSNHL